jgi:hypothetical protein
MLPFRDARLDLDDGVRRDAVLARRDDADGERDGAVVDRHRLDAELPLLRVPGHGSQRVHVRRGAEVDSRAEWTADQFGHTRIVEEKIDARRVVRGGDAEVDLANEHASMRKKKMDVARGDVGA